MIRYLLRLAAAFLLTALAHHVAGMPVHAQEALEVYRDAANYQNNDAFELAVEEWETFLQRFADDKRAPTARYHLGVCYLQLKQFEPAMEQFQTVVTGQAGKPFDLLQDAYLNLGSAQYAMGKEGNGDMFGKAAETFVWLLEAFPEDRGKYTDQALYYQGEALYDGGSKAEAAAAYEQLVNDHPESKLRADGLYALGATREELREFAAAESAYTTFLNELEDHRLATEVRMRRAETLLQSGKIAEAEKEFTRVAAVEGFVSADSATMRQAFCAWKQGKFQEAGELYAKVTGLEGSQHANEAVLLAGRSYYRANQFEEAKNWLQKAVGTDASHAAEAAHWLCRILLRENQPNQAAELAQQHLAVAEGSPYLANLKMDRAEALFELSERRSESLALFLKIAADHADHEVAAEALYNAAFTALDLKQYVPGIEHAAQFLKQHKDHRLAADVKHVSAECNLLLDKLVESEAMYRDLTSNHADHAEIGNWRIRLGLTLLLQKKYEETIQALQPILGDPKHPAHTAEAQFMIGTSLLEQQKYDQAVSALLASLAADPKWNKADETLINLSRAQRKLKQYDEAAESIRKVLAEFQQSNLLDQAHYWYGEARSAAGDYQTAVDQYGQVIEKYPASPLVAHALSGQGWSRFRLKDYEAGAASFTALITSHPDHSLVSDAHYARALCRRNTQDDQGTIEDLDAFLKTDPSKARKTHALFLRGLAQVELKKYEPAAVSFQQTLKVNPEYHGADRVKYQLGWAYLLLKKKDEAIEWFHRLADDHADSRHAAEAFYHIGEHEYRRNKEYAAAIESYALCKAKAPEGELGEKSTYMLGWCHFQLKKYDAAAAEFSEQIEKFPAGGHFADGLFMKAECLFKQDKFSEALPVYLEAKQLPNLAEDRAVLVLLNGGRAAGQLEQWQESLQLLEPITENFPDSRYTAEALFEQGVAKLRLEKLDESIELFSQAASKSRGEIGARARFWLGEVRFLKKEFPAALKEYQRVLYGFGGDDAVDPIKPWQARAGFQAGQATLVLAGEASDAAEKSRLIEQAKKYFTYVVQKHPTHPLAKSAKNKLDQL